jgi:hypothetical protein
LDGGDIDVTIEDVDDDTDHHPLVSGHLDSLVDYQGRDRLTVDLQAVPAPAPVELTVGKLAKNGQTFRFCSQNGGSTLFKKGWSYHWEGLLSGRVPSLVKTNSQLVSSPFTISVLSFHN